MTVMGRGKFTAQLTRIDLHRLRMIQFSDNLPRVLHTAAVTGLAIILFRTQPGSSLPWGGLEVEPTSIVRFSEGEDAFQHSSGAASFGTMSLPVEDMASIGETLTGCDLTPPSNAMLVAPPAAALARLQRLH